MVVFSTSVWCFNSVDYYDYCFVIWLFVSLFKLLIVRLHVCLCWLFVVCVVWLGGYSV